ncbi:hypothetical protein TKK_0002411 [Trichogramma kaykai]
MYRLIKKESDLIEILSLFKGTGDFLYLIMNKQSKNRKAFIKPGLSNEINAILKETSIDEYLYGKYLSVKIKELKSFPKEGEGLVKATSTSATPFSVNQEALYSGSQLAGYTNTRGCQIQRLLSR